MIWNEDFGEILEGWKSDMKRIHAVRKKDIYLKPKLYHIFECSVHSHEMFIGSYGLLIYIWDYVS